MLPGVFLMTTSEPVGGKRMNKIPMYYNWICSRTLCKFSEKTIILLTHSMKSPNTVLLSLSLARYSLTRLISEESWFKQFFIQILAESRKQQTSPRRNPLFFYSMCCLPLRMDNAQFLLVSRHKWALLSVSGFAYIRGGDYLSPEGGRALNGAEAKEDYTKCSETRQKIRPGYLSL